MIVEPVPQPVYAFDQVGSFAARPAGLALTGVVAEAVGEQRWLLVVATVMAVSAVAAAALPSVRRLERHQPV
ncbi:hypothetical protein [Arsenicicoccus sp. oral taxon 190]|uniref:hypothetical protein n=1 Tax=Arsenicicoccus sp. oral taxon 190 TaxID=1658671 RepID=UPI00067A3397|nr:hypothetical protein [Arsenicicoccus sp. oral taxon 190]AKT50593.1 hypothetical protein ADJ73_03445 [Arsenicicoccus sp. oral taxon 190]